MGGLDRTQVAAFELAPADDQPALNWSSAAHFCTSKPEFTVKSLKVFFPQNYFFIYYFKMKSWTLHVKVFSSFVRFLLLPACSHLFSG